MVGRTGPVSRGFRLRRPTRLREAASPCRDDKTSPCRMILNAALIPGLPPPPRLHTARPVSVFISPPQFLPDISARTTYHSPQSRIGIPRPRTAVWGENRDRRSGIRDQGSSPPEPGATPLRSPAHFGLRRAPPLLPRNQPQPSQKPAIPRHAGRRSECRERRTENAAHPLSSLPSKNQPSSFDIRSNR